ncbi:MAG: transcriptional regulator FtsR [Aeromicrobium sp.]
MTDAVPELARLGIGKVLEELHGEFPTLTISKIRFLEQQGLLEPERTASGYRKFTFADVERLRFILRQQAAPNFWPLSHLRQVLDEMDRGQIPDTTMGKTSRVPHLSLAADGLPSVETFREGRSQLRLSREELLESSGLDGDVLAAVEEFGLISRRPTQTYYDGDDLQVAALVADFSQLGLEPRHLRHFGAQADREANLVDQVVSPRSRSLDQEAAEQAAAALAALSVRLHTVLVRNRLRG